LTERTAKTIDMYNIVCNGRDFHWNLMKACSHLCLDSLPST